MRLNSFVHSYSCNMLISKFFGLCQYSSISFNAFCFSQQRCTLQSSPGFNERTGAKLRKFDASNSPSGIHKLVRVLHRESHSRRQFNMDYSPNFNRIDDWMQLPAAERDTQLAGREGRLDCNDKCRTNCACCVQNSI